MEEWIGKDDFGQIWGSESSRDLSNHSYILKQYVFKIH